MTNSIQNLTADIQNYNKVKDIVLGKLVDEGYIDEDDALEFSERCQVLTYKGNWFSNWFEKNISIENADKEKFYIKIVEMNNKESDVDKLLRRTTN